MTKNTNFLKEYEMDGAKEMGFNQNDISWIRACISKDVSYPHILSTVKLSN